MCPELEGCLISLLSGRFPRTAGQRPVGLLTAFEQATESRTEGSGADEGVRPTIELCGELLTQDTCAPPLFDRSVAGVWMPFVTR